MIVRYSQIIKSPVLLYREQAVLGLVLDVVVQKSDISIKGLILREKGLFRGKKYCSFFDVVAIESDSVVIQKEDSAVPESEAPAIIEAVESGMTGARRLIVTKSGKRVGFSYDYTVESESGLITSVYVKALFSDRIIGRESILSIEKRKIVIEDDFELVKSGGALAEGN